MGMDIEVCGEGFSDYEEHQRCADCDEKLISAEHYLKLAIDHLKSVLDVTKDHDMDMFDEWRAADAFLKEIENG